MSVGDLLPEVVAAIAGAAAGAARSGHESHRWIWREIRRTWAHAQAAHDALEQHAAQPADTAHREGKP